MNIFCTNNHNSTTTSFSELCIKCYRYLKEVKVTFLIPDKREPEFTFYDVTKAVVNVYRLVDFVIEVI